ncbi:MAG: electron transport complex subunit RsxC [Halioglobus sp.]
MRKIFDFHGGIHPPENKHQSVARAIAQAGIPTQLVIPVSQHIGAPAQPVVEEGDRVLGGQLIAAAKGFVSVPSHAPTSGTILAIEERMIAHPSGFAALCVVIETDGRDEWIELSGVDDYTKLEPGALINIIREAGIAGMGGAGFPSAVKLSIKPEIQIETLIINGTECEPYITADDILMRERPEQIIEGVKILRQIIQPRETVIGVEDNKPEGLAALRRAAEGSGIEVVEFPTKYPSGGEKQLIEILTGKQVPSGGLPADVGVVCQNVGTAVAIRAAVVEGRPLVSRITTLTGEALAQPQNYEVLIGTSMNHLLQLAGYDRTRNQRLIMGGPMMGFTVPDSLVPVVKTTNCILAPTVEEVPAPPPAQACIRCGMCAEVCPASLLPQQMFWFSQGKEFEKLEQHNLFDCIECGACSYACPSNIPLVQYYRASKAEIIQLRSDHEKSEQSRTRFEAREERLDREEAEKEAKRAARKKAAEARAKLAADGEGTEDPIQAAIDRAKAKKAAQQAGGKDSEVNELEKLQQVVATTRKRLDTATTKLTAAQAEGSDLVVPLQTGVDKTQAKLDIAVKALTEYQANEPKTDATENIEAEVDPAKLAIEKAMAARNALAALSPEDKAAQQLDKLEQRLAKAKARHAESVAVGEEEKIVIALEATVSRLEDKISAAREATNSQETT